MPAISPAPDRPARNVVREYLYSKMTRTEPIEKARSEVDVPEEKKRDAASHGPRRTEHLLFRLAVHEASHAVIRLYLGLGTITRITIDAPEGGYIAWRTDELHEQTEEFFTAVLAATLAGRAGEAVIIGSVGASGGDDRQASDHAVATRIAFDMETAMGFGQKWPLLHRGSSDPQFLLAIDPELAHHVNARLDAAYVAARKMVAKQRAAIGHLVEALLVHGTLEGSELEQVLDRTRKLIRE
ncbi:hypothetical protein [Mesorhizobium sp. CAU 1741]|uniref:hypothetical protein n=1 Tax=Mesorhizobium sp. CAU 1741 TaxID=3140366 RepID=UPI00325C309F